MQKEDETYIDYYNRLCSYHYITTEFPLKFFNAYTTLGKSKFLYEFFSNLDTFYRFDFDKKLVSYFDNEGVELTIPLEVYLKENIEFYQSRSYSVVEEYLDSDDDKLSVNLRETYLNRFLNDILKLILKLKDSDKCDVIIKELLRQLANSIVLKYQPIYSELIGTFLELNKLKFISIKGQTIKNRKDLPDIDYKKFAFNQSKRFNEEELNDIYDFLVDNGYIDKIIGRIKFKKVLRGVSIYPDKIHWKKAIGYLTEFIKFLQPRLNNSDQCWRIARNIFFHSNGLSQNFYNNRKPINSQLTFKLKRMSKFDT